MDIFDTINKFLPPEFTRIGYLILLLYIGYKVTRILDILDAAIARAERDRKTVLNETRDTLTKFNKQYNTHE